jgi:hypothetical protein
MLAALVIVDVALTRPPVKMLPAVTLPVVEIGPPAGGVTLATIVVAVIVPAVLMLPVALIVPPVTTLPPVMLPVADIVLVDVIACESFMTVVPLILIAIFVLPYFMNSAESVTGCPVTVFSFTWTCS